MMNLVTKSLRLGMISLAASGALVMAGCETPGEVGQEKTFNVDEASASDIKSALERDGKVTLTGGVVFETNSAKLSDQGRARVGELAAALQEHPEWNVAVIGYTDDTGNYDYNLKLSKERAESVVNALIKKYGIANTRLAPEGRGSLSPVASNATPEGRAQNRRVEVVIIK